MMIARLSLTVLLCLFFAAGAAAGDGLSEEQIYTLFSQANESFHRANAVVDNEGKADDLYEKAILGYEKIIVEGGIENPKLYYNLANAYFLRGDLGRAILNYRRAEKFDKSDAGIQKNLAFARSRRIDKVELKTEKRILQTLFFWHFDFSMKMKFVIGCVFLWALCLALTAMMWLGRRALLTLVAGISVVIVIFLIGSLVVDSYNSSTNRSGVIVSSEILARQGDGQNYPPSFKEPLHAGTEFELIESRPGWFHIKLANDSDGWIAQSGAGLI